MSKISEEIKTTVKKAAEKLTGAKRREYLAEITLELLDGNVRKAEREFGCSRVTVEKGIKELSEFKDYSVDELCNKRLEKYRVMGVYKE